MIGDLQNRSCTFRIQNVMKTNKAKKKKTYTKHKNVVVGLLSCYIVCFQGIPNCSLELVGLKLRMYGAQISDSFDSRVTHVVCDGR